MDDLVAPLDAQVAPSRPDKPVAVEIRTENYVLEHYEGDGVLWITFDHAGLPKHRADRRLGWAVPALTALGHSVLAVKAWRPDWFLGPDLAEFFRRPRFEAIRAGKRRVVLYGLSMGGFGALCYSTLVPGSTVVAISPQTTLHPGRVPWERRFDYARNEPWDGPFGDVDLLTPAHAEAYVIYSPRHRYDGLHIERISRFQPLTLLPLLGNAHVPGAMLQESGILKSIVRAVSAGAFSAEAFRAMESDLERSAAWHYYCGCDAENAAQRDASFARCLELAPAIRRDFYLQRIASARLRAAGKERDRGAAHDACRILRGLPGWDGSAQLKLVAARGLLRAGDASAARALVGEITARHPEGHPKLPQIMAEVERLEAAAAGVEGGARGPAE